MSSLLAERGPIHVNVGATLVLEGDPPTLEELLATWSLGWHWSRAFASG